MKELINYASQKGKYQDSYGECVVELEENETVEDVINKYIKGSGEKNWYERVYSSPKEISTYTQIINLKDVKDKVYTGRLVIMNTRNTYTG
jgi:hypothetical protein